MGVFRYVPRNLFRGAGLSGTIDANYQLSWLVDGIPGTPIQRTGNLAISINPGLVTVDTFALINHTVSVNTQLTNVITGTIVAAAEERTGIRFNPFLLVEPTPLTNPVDVAITSNPVPVVIGEFYAGLSDVLDYDFQLDLDPGQPFAWEGEYSSIPPYDAGLSDPRRLAGDLILTDAGFDKVKAWYAATNRGTLPSLIIPDDEVNDAWVGLFSYREQYVDMLHQVRLEFVELPRSAW